MTRTGEWEIGAVSRRVGMCANGVKTRVLEKFQNVAQDKTRQEDLSHSAPFTCNTD